MPTLSQMNVPTPKSWEEFEEITLDALKLRWKTSDLQKNGRKGQQQNGVDIYGYNDDYEFVGIQCKNKIALTSLELEDEIHKAETFTPKIKKFYFATTLPHDVKLEMTIRMITKERSEKNKFPIRIFFWEELINDLVSNPQILYKHYPQFLPKNGYGIKQNMAGLLDLSFWGMNFKLYMSIIFGEIGQISNVDPLEMKAICELIKTSSSFIKDIEKMERFIEDINEFESYVFTNRQKGMAIEWNHANDLGTDIEIIVKSIDVTLDSNELLVYQIGVILGLWDKQLYENSKIKMRIAEPKIIKFKGWIDVLDIDKDTKEEINVLLTKLNDFSSISNVQVPNRIYNLIRQCLIERALKVGNET